MKQRKKEEDRTFAFIGRVIGKGTDRASQQVDRQTHVLDRPKLTMSWLSKLV